MPGCSRWRVLLLLGWSRPAASLAVGRLPQVHSRCARPLEGRFSRVSTVALSVDSAPSAPRRFPTKLLLAGGIGTAAVAWREPLAVRSLLLLRAYERAALVAPLVTKALTSGVAYVLGDVLAQRLTAEGRVSKGRVVRSGVAGFVSHGPQLHFWSLLLDRFVHFGSGVWALRGAVAAKIALDQAVFALYINAAYCMTLEMLKRTPPKLAFARIRRAAWPSLKRSWQFWPAVHVVTFGLVPHHLRVLWVDAVEVVWVAVLATCVNRASSEVALEPEECTLDAQIPICAGDLALEPAEPTVPVATTGALAQ